MSCHVSSMGENLGVDERIILKFILKKQDVRMDWILLAQGIEMWRTVLQMLNNFWIPSKDWLAGWLLDSQE